jgi:membrane-associated protein
LTAVVDLASITDSITRWLNSIHGPLVYVVCGLLVFGEAAVLLGFVIPGETAALVGGALASLHHVSLGVMLAVIIGSAIIGDTVGFEVGRHLGPWLLQRRPLHGNAGVDKARDLLARHGGPAVFLGRWVAVARALVPGIAGVTGLRYRVFLFYNALGGIAWGTTFVLIGYAAGRSYQRIASKIGEYGLIVVGVVIVGAIIFVVVRRRGERKRRAAADETSPSEPAGPSDPADTMPGRSAVGRRDHEEAGG